MAGVVDFIIPGDPQITNLLEKSISLEQWRSQVFSFFEQIRTDLLQQSSYTLDSVDYIDLVTDLARPAELHFAASIFSLLSRSDLNPEGIYDEDDLYRIMQSHYQAIFNHSDILTKGKLHEMLYKSLRRIQACLESTMQRIGKSGLIADIVDRLHEHQTHSDYSVEVMQSLLHITGSLDVDTIVAKHMIAAAAALITQQSQRFVECLDYYLSEEGGSIHLPEIYRLAHMGNAEADEKLERDFLEGSWLACSLSLSRKMDFAQNDLDKGESKELIPSQRVICNMRSAFQDPKVFPNPSILDFARDENLYSLYGWSLSGRLDNVSKVALKKMLRTVGKLKDLRRAQGQLNAVEAPRGLMYMNAEQSRCSTILRQHAKIGTIRPDFPLELLLK